MRIIYLGTPEFAVPTMEKLLAWDKGQVVALVTQPDRPAGRGQKLIEPATKLIAQKHGIAIFQPERLSKSPETVAAMAQLKPDLLVMVAFGQILKLPVLNLAPLGTINLHASLLPKYRGPAPINWAIINGDLFTGVTTMFSDVGVDTGDLILQKQLPIGQDDTALDLSHKLANIGADLIIETMALISQGAVLRIKQDDSEATYAPLLKKEMGQICWRKPACDIHNLVRGLYPWPGTVTIYQSQLLKVLKTKRIDFDLVSGGVPGKVLSSSGRVVICCGERGDDAIEIDEVQPANRSRMKANDWANGVRLTPGACLGS